MTVTEYCIIRAGFVIGPDKRLYVSGTVFPPPVVRPIIRPMLVKQPRKKKVPKRSIEERWQIGETLREHHREVEQECIRTALLNCGEWPNR